MVAAFLSKEYTDSQWTDHEKSSALDRQFLESFEGRPYFYPFRFDKTPIKGLSKLISYTDLTEIKKNENTWSTDSLFKHPRHVADQLTRIMMDAGVGPPRSDVESILAQRMRSVRIMWITEEGVYNAEGVLPAEDVSSGSVSLNSRYAGIDIPSGRYDVLPREYYKYINYESPMMTLLMEDCTAYMRERMSEEITDSTKQEIIQQTYDDLRAVVGRENARCGAVSLGKITTESYENNEGKLVVKGTVILAKPTGIMGERY